MKWTFQQQGSTGKREMRFKLADQKKKKKMKNNIAGLTVSTKHTLKHVWGFTGL